MTRAIVQFPHPGGEHHPRHDVMPWNTGDHARKFMVAPGVYQVEEGRETRDRVVFWGEWEGPSRVVRRWPSAEPLPRFLQEPFFDTPPAHGARQNTDPWVFGERFLYSNCKQRTNKGRSATGMQDLDPGSLILFGSTKGDDFVLDTVFVVGERVGEYQPDRALRFEIDPTFRVATIESLPTTMGENTSQTFTLIAGASPTAMVDGMFSFVPCLPHDAGGPRFARPSIRLPGVINPASNRAVRGFRISRSLEEVQEAWGAVRTQVLDQDLLLATRLELANAVSSRPEPGPGERGRP